MKVHKWNDCAIKKETKKIKEGKERYIKNKKEDKEFLNILWHRIISFLLLVWFLQEKWPRNFLKDRIYEDIKLKYRPRSVLIEIQVTLSILKLIRVQV